MRQEDASTIAADAPPLPSAGQLVRDFGPARRALGQCFLRDPSILRRLVEMSDLEPGARVVEIGPGPGTLTRTLLAAGCEVVAVEVDRRAVEHLRVHLDHPALRVLEGDALKLAEGEVVPGDWRDENVSLVGNLPYNIATEIFFRFEALPTITGMTLMFQREVGRRFLAIAGEKAYGPLAILSRIRWTPRLLFDLPPGAFVPRPKVYSFALRFVGHGDLLVEAVLEPTFRRLVRTAFQQRRKTVRNALAALVDKTQLEAAGIDPGVRPERIGPERYAALAHVVGEQARAGG